MKKRVLACFLLVSLLLVGCVGNVSETSSSDPSAESSTAISSEELSAEDSSASESETNSPDPSAESSAAISSGDLSAEDSSASEEESALTFNGNQPPFASYADFETFIEQSDGEAMVIRTNRNPETDTCDWEYAATDWLTIEDNLTYFSSTDDNLIKDAYIRDWIVFPSGMIYGCFSPEVSALAQRDEHDDRLFGVKCRINNDPDEPFVGFTYGYLDADLYPNILYALGLLDEEVAKLSDEELFMWIPHQPPFALSTFYEDLQRRADGRAVVCTTGLDENYNEVWTYKFVEMQDGPQALKDGEDTVILQSSPYMKNIWFYEFVFFPDGTVYGVYPPSVSAHVADICEVDTDRDYGAIFTVDTSGYHISYEKTDCFLPEGVFELLERELGEIETEENKYIFEVPEKYLTDDPTGLPFETKEDLRGIVDNLRFTCFERVTGENGTMHWETVYRWGGQDPIWQIDELFTPTDKNYYGDGYDLFLIDTPAADYDRSDGSLISIRMYAMFAETAHDEVIEGYEDCAGKPYGAIYTFDMTADKLTYTVEYGYFEKSIASFIDVAD